MGRESQGVERPWAQAHSWCFCGSTGKAGFTSALERRGLPLLSTLSGSLSLSCPQGNLTTASTLIKVEGAEPNEGSVAPMLSTAYMQCP